MSKKFLVFFPNTISVGEKPVERHGIALMADSAKGKNVGQSMPSEPALASSGLSVP